MACTSPIKQDTWEQQIPEASVPATDATHIPTCHTVAIGLETQTDEVLLAKIGQASTAALSVLFRRYARAVFSLASRILKDPCEAEDMVQEVFLLLFEKAKLFDPAKGAAASWIMRITYLRALDRRKYLGSRQHYTSEPVDDQRLYTSEREVATNALSAKRLLERLRGDITSEQRQTLELHFFDGYTFQEIAERTGQNIGNVRNHYYRGISRLRSLVFQENSAQSEKIGKQ